MKSYTGWCWFLMLGSLLDIQLNTPHMATIKGIDNYLLPAKDLAASRTFYHKVLGLPVKFDFSDRGLLAFQVGDGETAIILKDQHTYPDAAPVILLEVDDVQVLYDSLQQQGIKFTKPPYRIRTGWAAELQDPSGNLIGITDYRKN